MLVRTDEPVAPFTRTIEDVELVWRCEVGHEFHAAGQVEPRVCWTCGRPAYPVAQYACPIHGPFDVVVKFRRNKDGVADPSALKLIGREWVPVENPLECPRCRRPLTRVPPDSRPPQPPREQTPRSERRDRP